MKTAVLTTGPFPTSVPEEYEWLLVRVITDEGIEGYGETYADTEAVSALEATKKRLIGTDPTNINRIQTLAQGQWRSGIEMACWDILGKSLGAPLYKLFGGKYRDRVQIYADSGGPIGWGLGSPDPQAFTERAQQVLSRGFTAMKVDLDTPRHLQIGYNRTLSEAEVNLMVEQIKAVREVIGDRPLAADCHWKYSTNDAIFLANRLEPFHLWWLEDPIPSGNVDALLTVKNATQTPISVGEVLTSRHEFRELIEKQATSILGPDSRTTGGLLEFKAIADIADLYYIPCAPHNMTTPIGTLATVHVCAAIQNFVALEHHFQDIPWWDNLVKHPRPVIRKGYIEVPEKPGIGVEVNDLEILKHIKHGKSFFS